MMPRKKTPTSTSKSARRGGRVEAPQTRRRTPPAAPAATAVPGKSVAASKASSAALVGAMLREHRRLLNLTLQEVANRAGITKGFLSEIERDKAVPSVATLMRLRDALS